MYQLNGWTNKKKDNKETKAKATKEKSVWTDQHQKSINLTSLFVLGYLDFSQPFGLEMDVSLQQLGSMLFQRDEYGWSRITAYPVNP